MDRTVGGPDDKPQDAFDEIGASNRQDKVQYTPTKPRLWATLTLIVVVVAVFTLAWSELNWARTFGGKEPDGRLTVLPMRWLILTNVNAVTMWWVAMCLSRMHDNWQEFDRVHGPKLLFMRESGHVKPPDPKQRETGKDKKGQQILAHIIERHQELQSKPTVLDRLLRRKPQGARRRILLLALQAASTIAIVNSQTLT